MLISWIEKEYTDLAESRKSSLSFDDCWKNINEYFGIINNFNSSEPYIKKNIKHLAIATSFISELVELNEPTVYYEENYNRTFLATLIMVQYRGETKSLGYVLSATTIEGFYKTLDEFNAALESTNNFNERNAKTICTFVQLPDEPGKAEMVPRKKS